MISALEQLKKLLWEEWDPIGVNDIEDAKDEYDSYAFEIFVMLKSGKTKQDLLKYFEWAETEHMRVGHSGRAEMIVDRALEIHRRAS